MIFRSIISLPLVFFACALPILAAEPHYLDATAIDAVKLLPGPPSPKSDENQAELELILAIQQRRTPEQIERCASEAKLDMTAFRSVEGEWFTPANLPKLNKLLRQCEKDSKHFSEAVKDFYDRKRPYVEDSRIHPPEQVQLDTSPAYPSGHAMRGILFAKILAKVDRSNRDRLMERGREIGWDRVVAGLHHPSDTTAGRVLGNAVADALLASPEFQRDLADAKAEFLQVEKHYAAPIGAGASGN